jgi:hypothetical protein
VTRPRPKPLADVVVLDEAALEHRFRSLSRWFLLTQQGGADVQLAHMGTVRQRLTALEELIDQLPGVREKAEAHLRHLADGRRRWPSGDPYDPDRSAA